MARIYLKVPYSQKEQAKACGARWDAKNKSWYVNNSSSFEKHPQLNQWRIPTAEPKHQQVINRDWPQVWRFLIETYGESPSTEPPNPTYVVRWDPWRVSLYPIPLNTTFDDKDHVKALGAKWAQDVKCWYLPVADMLLDNPEFVKWLPNEIQSEVEVHLSDARKQREEFAERLEQYESWLVRPPRFESAKELLGILGLKISQIKQESGFCRMCDSRVSNTWAVVDDNGKFEYELCHISQYLDYSFRPSKTQLNPLEYQIVEDYFLNIELNPEKGQNKESISTKTTPNQYSNRKITVSQLSQLGKCEQQLVYDNSDGEKRSKDWVRKGKEGSRVHEKYEAQLNSEKEPTLTGADKRCFIATASFGPEANEVRQLRIFRDQFLLKSSLGRIFVRLYYASSPKIAQWLDRHSFARKFSRIGLKVIIRCLKLIGAVT